MRKRSDWIWAVATIISFVLVCAAGIGAQEIVEEEEGLYSTVRLTDRCTVGDGKRIDIKSASTLSGKLVIVAGVTESASLIYVKKSRADSRSRAIDYIDLVAVDLDATAEGARLELRAPNPARWGSNESGMVEAELTVPEGSFIEVDATMFDVSADGPFSGVLVPQSLGRLEVTSVDGELELSTANRRVAVADIRGKVYVSTTNASLEADDIQCIDHQATFRNQNGDIRIYGLTGEVSVRNSFGRIDLINYTPYGRRNIIRGRSGPVMAELLDFSDAQVIITNRFEDIDLTVPSDLSSSLSLAVGENGKIEVSGLVFEADLVQETRMSLIAGDGESSINCTVQGDGNVYVRGVEK